MICKMILKNKSELVSIYPAITETSEPQENRKRLI